MTDIKVTRTHLDHTITVGMDAYRVNFTSGATFDITEATISYSDNPDSFGDNPDNVGPIAHDYTFTGTLTTDGNARPSSMRHNDDKYDDVLMDLAEHILAQALIHEDEDRREAPTNINQMSLALGALRKISSPTPEDREHGIPTINTADVYIDSLTTEIERITKTWQQER